MGNSSTSFTSPEMDSSLDVQKEEINLSDDLFCKTLNERLIEYRRSKTFTDLKIKIQDKEFHAHKIVLIDSSPILNTMISQSWLEENILELNSKKPFNKMRRL